MMVGTRETVRKNNYLKQLDLLLSPDSVVESHHRNTKHRIT
jgi:hypothetical protein